jgi:hypothetical protein
MDCQQPFKDYSSSKWQAEIRKGNVEYHAINMYGELEE